ncbi:hypothetical protein OAO48_04540 [Alphaproteobacteria bacterium]|nr:hypothetical protein [Alphaproteobacteria bacterium]
MKMFFTIIISFILMSFNSVFAEESLDNSLENKNTIECSSEPVIKYIPIKGMDNSSLMYAVLINHKKKKYQLVSDDNNNLKCVFN